MTVEVLRAQLAPVMELLSNIRHPEALAWPLPAGRASKGDGPWREACIWTTPLRLI